MIRLGLVGLGRIALAQHLPAIAASPAFALRAACDPAATAAAAAALPEGVALHCGLEAMIAAGGIDAVALCTPPRHRFRLAREAIAAGLHVLLEKPPAQTLAEAAALEPLAAARGVTLFAAWHARFADGVEPARAVLRERGGAASMRIDWREDVAAFHPGQDWFWQPGGMGVFDPGVNALSIAVACMEEPLFVRAARFAVSPGRHGPVLAELALATPAREHGFGARFDWSHRGEPCWTIGWTLGDGGSVSLWRGGHALAVDGAAVLDGADREYPRVYERFASLVAEGRSELDLRPLMLATDAFALAERV